MGITNNNIQVDGIEWMYADFRDRECITLSVHSHNDIGAGVASAELTMLAGADIVEIYEGAALIKAFFSALNRLS